MIIMPMAVPMPTYPASGYSSKNIAPLDWSKAPAWAAYAAINVIGGWNWWAAKPKWSWFGQAYEGDILNQPALVHVLEYSPKTRKASLHARPGGSE